MTQLELFKREVYPWVTIEQRCQALVVAMVGMQASERWWKGYNLYFKNSPERVMKYAPVSVYEYLMGMAAGVYF